MAQQTIVNTLSDLSGEAADETLTFAVNGVAYEIDLTEDEAQAFHDFVVTYVEAGRKVEAPARKSTTSGGSGSNVDGPAVREWAALNGFTVKDRGRLPQDVLAAYAAAQS
jgi:hypothetical protein